MQIFEIFAHSCNLLVTYVVVATPLLHLGSADDEAKKQVNEILVYFYQEKKACIAGLLACVFGAELMSL